MKNYWDLAQFTLMVCCALSSRHSKKIAIWRHRILIWQEETNFRRSSLDLVLSPCKVVSWRWVKTYIYVIWKNYQTMQTICLSYECARSLFSMSTHVLMFYMRSPHLLMSLKATFIQETKNGLDDSTEPYDILSVTVYRSQAQTWSWNCSHRKILPRMFY